MHVSQRVPSLADVEIRHVLLVGGRTDAASVFGKLPHGPYRFSWAEHPGGPVHGRRPDVVLFLIGADGCLPPGADGYHVTPWVAWNLTVDERRSLAAYEQGARRVLAAGAQDAAVADALEHALADPGLARVRGRAGGAAERVFRAGDRIPLSEDEVLHVRAGVVAQRVIHADGSDVLIGVCGPGGIVIGHPADGCCLDLLAHTAVSAQVTEWRDVATTPAVVAGLRDRVRQMEAWSAAQARTHLEHRLLDLLSLLAEQFGRPQGAGVLVDVRLTHDQLARATAATRATVTRAVGTLKRRRLLWTVGRGAGLRLCVRPTHLTAHLRRHT